MEFVIGILLLIALTAGTVYLVRQTRNAKKEMPEQAETVREVPAECCGAHEVCEFDASIFEEKPIVYFDDEELDRHAGKQERDYSDNEIDEMREILYTLQPKEINNWLNSLDRRKILLPGILQQEARQLIADDLAKKAS